MGRTFDSQYFIEYETGEGTFGQILVVKDKQSGDKKNAKAVTTRNRNLDLTQIRKSLNNIKQLSHPHICNISEYTEDHGDFYIMSEHTEGGELQDFLERIASSRNWLDERTVALYVQQILMATTYMHNNGVIHGELKPTSILLTSKLPDAKVRVTDFGIAQVFDPTCRSILMRPSCCMPPEHIEFNNVDTLTEKTDTWAIGAITSLMLVNKVPFGEAVHPKELFQLLMKPPKFFAEDGWAERSWLSRDFIRCLLCPAQHRLTAAQALAHEWIRTFASEPYSIPPNLSSEKRACVSKKRPDQKNIVTAGLLIAAALLPSPIFESHRDAFNELDTNGDGFILAEEAEHMWAQSGTKWSPGDVKRMMGYVALTGTVDISTFVVVGVMLESEAVRHAPSAAEAATLISRQAFKIFDIRGTVRWNDILHKVQTKTAAQIEAASATPNTPSPVCFPDIASAVPADRGVDMDGFVQCIDEHDGRGTPFLISCDDSGLYAEDDLDEIPWIERLSFNNWPSILKPLASCGFTEASIHRPIH